MWGSGSTRTGWPLWIGGAIEVLSGACVLQPLDQTIVAHSELPFHIAERNLGGTARNLAGPASAHQTGIRPNLSHANEAGVKS